ncbi:hypothetical protein JYQ62_29020 [Nostoc sp. UHCC 0702]|nr:hypothetical protein JYQ62_29020 [Nostoc sp. UHCC 0702]
MNIDEFLQRVRLERKGNSWSVLVVPNLDSQQLVDDLKDTLTIFTECEVICLSANGEATNLVEKIINTNEAYLILWDFNQWDNHKWYELDCQRSKLIRKQKVVLVLSPETVKTMFNYAPNLVSLVAFKIYNFSKDTELLTSEERQTRLAKLQEWSGLSDSEVIEMAEAQTLPPDPEYAEWLVLLERGDLIEQ